MRAEADEAKEDRRHRGRDGDLQLVGGRLRRENAREDTDPARDAIRAGVREPVTRGLHERGIVRVREIARKVCNSGERRGGRCAFEAVAGEIARARVDREARDDEEQDRDEGEDRHRLTLCGAPGRPVRYWSHGHPHDVGASRITVYCVSVWVKNVRAGEVYLKTRRTPSSDSFGCVWLRLSRV